MYFTHEGFVLIKPAYQTCSGALHLNMTSPTLFIAFQLPAFITGVE
jgi:hypothetical protein